MGDCITDTMTEEEKAKYEEMLDLIGNSFTEEELETIKKLLDKHRANCQKSQATQSKEDV